MSKMDKFFADIEKEITATAGIVASSYAKDATKAIAEEWAEILARNIEMGLNVSELAAHTKKERAAHKNPEEPALFETGELVSNIEFRWTSMPSRNYDLLEVGIWEDDKIVGHSNNITPYKLGLMNEYGFSGSFEGKDGKVHIVNIPARPHFMESAIDIGYAADHILSDEWNKVRVAIGRERRSILSNNLTGNMLNDLSVSAPGRYRGTGSNETQIGRFHVVGRNIIFGWDEDAVDSDEESPD